MQDLALSMASRLHSLFLLFQRLIWQRNFNDKTLKGIDHGCLAKHGEAGIGAVIQMDVAMEKK